MRLAAALGAATLSCCVAACAGAELADAGAAEDNGGSLPDIPAADAEGSAADVAASIPDGGSDAAAREPSPCPDDMAHIPAGTFTMGAELGVANPDAQPPHDVSLAAYCLDRHEVSVAAYQACAEAGGCFDLTTFVLCQVGDPDRPNSCKMGREDHPVNYVSWDRARAYCEWRGKRLPTEAEWEMAARAPDGRTYPWGEQADCEVANHERGFVFDACKGWDGLPDDTHPVDSHPLGRSHHGLVNLGGNVDEWVHDWYAATYYSASPTAAPRGPETGEWRAFRGGNFLGPDFLMRGFHRQAGLSPEKASQSHGIRCAGDPTPGPQL